MRAAQGAIVMVVAALCSFTACAQSQAAYPSRTIRLIVPWPPGGSTDALARIVAQRLTTSMGQQVVVDNRPGAGGNIGTAIAAKGTPDGHVLVLVSSSFVVNPSLYSQVPYDAVRDFQPVSYIASAPSVLLLHPSVAARSVKELVALTKASPGTFNCASPGAGTAQHFAVELFKLAAGASITHVPYTGATMMPAVIGGHVQMGIISVPAAQPHVASGALRALAITSLKRSPAMPDVPTFDESGYRNFEVDHMQGLLVPAGTPRAIVDRLSAEIAKAIEDPDVRKRLLFLGFDPVGNKPDEFAKQIRVQLVKWEKLVREAGIKVE
jgi:tripartite-type tricarboxylate transporter receptor subunit TctC